jgi:hypothetical protein
MLANMTTLIALQFRLPIEVERSQQQGYVVVLGSSCVVDEFLSRYVLLRSARSLLGPPLFFTNPKSTNVALCLSTAPSSWARDCVSSTATMKLPLEDREFRTYTHVSADNC